MVRFHSSWVLSTAAIASLLPFVTAHQLPSPALKHRQNQNDAASNDRVTLVIEPGAVPINDIDAYVASLNFLSEIGLKDYEGSDPGKEQTYGESGFTITDAAGEISALVPRKFQVILVSQAVGYFQGAQEVNNTVFLAKLDGQTVAALGYYGNDLSSSGAQDGFEGQSEIVQETVRNISGEPLSPIPLTNPILNPAGVPQLNLTSLTDPPVQSLNIDDDLSTDSADSNDILNVRVVYQGVPIHYEDQFWLMAAKYADLAKQGAEAAAIQEPLQPADCPLAMFVKVDRATERPFFKVKWLFRAIDKALRQTVKDRRFDETSTYVTFRASRQSQPIDLGAFTIFAVPPRTNIEID